MLATVAGWKSGRGLKLSVSKSEAIVLTTKRGYQQPSFLFEGTQLQLKEHIRYLGIELCKQLGYRKYLECVTAKAAKTVASLSRLMPNIGGPKTNKRQLLMTVVQSQLLYAAPIWASVLVFERNIKILEFLQRKMSIWIACAYRTVSLNAILVMPITIPMMHLLAAERCTSYHTKKSGSILPSKQDIRSEALRKWKSEWIDRRKANGRKG